MNTSVTVKGIERLADIDSLECLIIPPMTLTGDKLRPLCKLPNLKNLILKGSTFDEAAVRHLAAMQSLDILTLDKSNIGGLELSHFSRLTHLKVRLLMPLPDRISGTLAVSEIPVRAMF